MAKGFIQREGIDYNKTFSSVLCKDSFRIIMVLVAHYDLQLHQKDVKTHSSMGICRKSLHDITQKVLSLKEKNVRDVA